MSNTSDNNNTSYISTIEHKPYSENTAIITDSLKQQYQNVQTKFQEPQVQEKWGQTKTILFDRTKEFGYLTLDFTVKSFEITKAMFTQLYQVYKK